MPFSDKTWSLQSLNWIRNANQETHKIFLLQCHGWLARILFFLFAGAFHAFLTRSYLEPIRYEFHTFLNVTPKSFCLLSGLWLSSTKWGARHRIVTSLLLLPSFAFAFFFQDDYGWMVSFIALGIIFWSYWIVISQERLSK